MNATNEESVISKRAASKLARRFVLVVAIVGVVAAVCADSPRAQPLPNQPLGQTATRLPDGQWLLLGGEGDLGNQVQLVGATAVPIMLLARPLHPRSGHSATVLPDGRVLVLGGVDSSGAIVAQPEIFDPKSRAFSAVSIDGLIPRAYHSATVVSDGRVLVVGGVDEKSRPVTELELWNPATGDVEVASGRLGIARMRHTATLLPTGQVLVSDGIGNDGKLVDASELLDPATGRAEGIATADAQRMGLDMDGTQVPAIQSSTPAPDATGFVGQRTLAVRFTKRMSVSSLNSYSVTLIGPAGSEPIRAVPAEQGVLLFVQPARELLPASRYTLFISGAIDATQRALPLSAIGFDTAAKSSTSGLAGLFATTIDAESQSGATAPDAWGLDLDAQLSKLGAVEREALRYASVTTDSEDWVPGPAQFKGRWLADRTASPLQALPPLQAPPGVTALTGQVLGMNGTAVSGVTLQIGVQSTRTDITGRFLLAQLPAGFAKLEIDGETANRPGAQYGYYAARVEVKPQQTTVVPYTIWMPRLDPAGIVGIAAPTTAEIVVSSPRIPGLELHIPAGTVVRDRHGGIVTELNITAIPVDRPPFPVPDLGVPVYFTVQPGGAILESASDKPTPGARLFYPNFKNEVPGARGVFWNYDSADRGWFVYGLGTISHEGRQSIPDDGVVIHEFTGAMFNGAGAPGPEGPPPCAAQTCCSADDMGIGDTSSGGEAGTCGFDGDPVSLYTGQFDRTERDLVLNDVMPISITRTYYSADVNQRAFGIGMTHQYDMFFFSKNQYQETDLLLPNGTRVHYARTSPGTDYHDAIMESNSPGVWKSSIVAYNTGRGGWDLTFRDGRKWFFGDNAPLLEMSDANGNVTSIIRSDGKSGRITRVVSPNGRTIDFSYTGGGLVSALTDSLGRSTFYNYDTNGHLIEMIDPLGGVREYGWDTINHRMTSIHDAGGKLLIQNEYDLLGRLTRQTLGDGSSYAYAYTLVNLSPTPPPGIPQPPPDIRVSRTDITNRRGMIRIVDFNPRTGDLVQSRFPAGLPDEQVNTYEYNDAQLTARIDALGRRTEYQYDTAGNTTQVTHLAGTDMAVSASVAYDGLSNRPLIITDSNGNVTTLSYDEKGNLLSAQNAPGEVWTYTYDAQGRRLTRTNPLGNVTTWSYDHADLVGVTDAIGRRVQLFSDTGGRLLSIVDSLGNRMVDRWDGLDRVLSITDPLGGITSVSYDASGNLVNHTDANGNATAYTYNARNKLQTTQDALGKIETLSYEPGGKVAQKTDRKGQLQSRIYDAVGRLHIIGFGATSGNPTAYTRQIENTWDAANRLTQIVETTCADPNGHPGCSSVTTTSTITRGYDDLNRMVREVTPLGQIDYTYDNAGRKTSMTITNGGLGAQVVQPTVTYSYDNADRLTGIHQAAADINEGQAQDIVLVYDKAGQRTQTRLANGVTVNYEYDDAGQNVSIVYNAADGSLIGDLQYEYDAAGSRTGVGGSLARTSLPAADTTDIAYDANNRLVRWDGQTYAYDDTGNLISDGANDYEWDENNRLIGIRNQGVAIAGFQYDSWGRRVGKTIGSETTGFLYDGANVAQELGGTTREAAVKAHVLSGRTDEVFLRMDGNSGANRQSVLSDSNNNTVMLLDAAQASVVSYTYEPYGMTTADGPSNNAYQYTGRENDNPGNSQGLYYCRARYYMPGIARFISQDPIGWASGQTNNYAYVGGDPISYLDPTGLGKGGKTRGPHMTESSNISDALEQESGIAGAQRRAREAGIGDDTIRSINKSEQNTDYRLSRIRNYADAQDDEEELEKVGEAAELVETEEGVRDTLETVEDVEESAGILARIGQLIDILE